MNTKGDMSEIRNSTMGGMDEFNFDEMDPSLGKPLTSNNLEPSYHIYIKNITILYLILV